MPKHDRPVFGPSTWPLDDPRLPISEQEALGRDRYAIPQESRSVGPPSGDNYLFGK